MPRIRTRRAFLLALALAVTACAESGAQSGAAPPNAAAAAGGLATPGSPAATPTASPSADRFEATIASAPFAGTHAAAGPMTCMMFNGTWQAVHEAERTDGLSGMLLQVNRVPPAGGSSDDVALTLTFGRMGDESGAAGLLYLYGIEAGGDARGTIERQGGGAVIRIEGTAQTGARTLATLRCASVDFMQ